MSVLRWGDVADAADGILDCFTERGGPAVSDRNRHLGVGVRRRRGLAGRPARRESLTMLNVPAREQPRAAGRMTSEAGRRPVPARHKCDFRWGGSGYDALSQRRRTNCREADRRSCERPASVARRIEAWGCWRSGAAESRSRGWPLLRATVLPVACRRVGSMVLPPSEPIGRGDRPPGATGHPAVCRVAQDRTAPGRVTDVTAASRSNGRPPAVHSGSDPVLTRTISRPPACTAATTALESPRCRRAGVVSLRHRYRRWNARAP